MLLLYFLFEKEKFLKSNITCGVWFYVVSSLQLRVTIHIPYFPQISHNTILKLRNSFPKAYKNFPSISIKQSYQILKQDKDIIKWTFYLVFTYYVSIYKTLKMNYWRFFYHFKILKSFNECTNYFISNFFLLLVTFRLPTTSFLFIQA